MTLELPVKNKKKIYCRKCGNETIHTFLKDIDDFIYGHYDYCKKCKELFERSV